MIRIGFLSFIFSLYFIQPGQAQVTRTTSFSMTDLGSFGFVAPNEVEAINDFGDVVGWQVAGYQLDFPVFTFLYHGYLWSRGERREFVPTSEHQHCHTRGLNNEGVIVGTSFSNSGPASLGCVFDRESGEAMPLILEGGKARSILALNAVGVMVGIAEIDEDGQNYPFRFDPNRNEVQYFTSMKNGVPKAINDSGVVVGFYRTRENGERGFKADPNGEPVDLQSLLPPQSLWVIENAVGINNDGMIVGNGRYNGLERAFRGRFDGTDPEILQPVEGDAISKVDGINNSGLAVGYSQYWIFPVVRWSGTYWVSDSSLPVDINLNTPDRPTGVWIEGIRALNNHGQMVARVASIGVHQYLLTPQTTRVLSTSSR